MSYKHLWMGWLLAATLCQVSLAACDDSNGNAAPESVSTAGRSSSSKKSSAGKGGSASDGKAGEGSTSNSQSSESKGGSGGGSTKEGSGSGGKGGSMSAAKGGSSGSDDKSEPQDCKDQGPKDCVCEVPKSDAQFLNHCSGATCSPFDNSKLTKLKDGKLPALP